MKLNYDLIRDLLLAIEDISDGSINYYIGEIQEKHLQNYELKEIEYHVKQLSQGGIIQIPRSSPHYVIDLTWYGHQYLSNVRDNTIWSKTKERIKPLGSVAFDLVFEISKSLILKSLTPNP